MRSTAKMATWFRKTTNNRDKANTGQATNRNQKPPNTKLLIERTIVGTGGPNACFPDAQLDGQHACAAGGHHHPTGRPTFIALAQHVIG